MSDFGHVKISRKAFATDRFWNEPREFSKWEAWEWMIQEAAWGGHERPVGMSSVHLARGEFIGSIQFLAKAWMWTPKRVRSFLDLVIDLERIRVVRETHFGTVYLLVNYRRYQDAAKTSLQKGHSKGTEKGTARGTEKGTEKVSKEAVFDDSGAQLGARKRAQSRTEKGHIVKAIKEIIPPIVPHGGTDQFETAWAAYPRRPNNSKAAARKAWMARIRAGVDPAAMVDGVQRYAAYILAKRTDPEHVKMASTFFGPDEHWESDFTTNGNGHAVPIVRESI